MADVARLAGTSTAVVSYVLNDGPRPVAAATRARVLAAAAKLGYRRNRVAAALRSGMTGLVGLVLPDMVNPYFATLGRYLETELAAAGKLTIIANSGYAADRQAAAIEGLHSAQVDGLIIAWAGERDPVTPNLATTAVVHVHDGPPGSTTRVVTADDHTSVAAAVAHLRQHGHDRIDLLAGLNDDGPIGDRVTAWRAVATGRLLRSAYSRAAAARLIRDLDQPPRALVVATDEQAIGVLAAANAASIAIPDRLALISCDGTPDTEYTVPSLTVVAQPFAEIARRAVRILLGHEEPTRPITATLTIRCSCGCPHPSFP